LIFGLAGQSSAGPGRNRPGWRLADRPSRPINITTFYLVIQQDKYVAFASWKCKQGKNNYKPAVFCSGYYYEFSYNAVIKITKSNPSSNRPEKCRVCSTYLWSYNMLCHFQDNHHGAPCDFLIIEDDKESVLNFKTGFKN
jgi:hypothetical protein